VRNSPARWPVMKLSEPRWYSDTPGNGRVTSSSGVNEIGGTPLQMNSGTPV
jgi:hypothetical protein